MSGQERKGKEELMIETGTRIEMSKGYKGVKGIIIEKTASQFEFYVVRLENGIHIVVGPSAFVIDDQSQKNT